MRTPEAIEKEKARSPSPSPNNSPDLNKEESQAMFQSFNLKPI